MENLDSDLLRTFVAVADAGSVTSGAAQVFRSQSAASVQIKRLETILGQAVFERHGRGVLLTDAGRHLLPVARDVTARLDGVLRDLAADKLRGRLRLGIPDDHGRARLASIVGAFTRSHPQVELEVVCAISAGFPGDLAKGRLDLAVYEVATPDHHEEVLFEDPTHWMMSSYRDLTGFSSLPVALFDHACWWRDVALDSLTASQRSFRIVYSSQSVAGVLAAVEAGVAIGLLGRSSMSDGVEIVDKACGLEPTPVSRLVLGAREGGDQVIGNAMKSAIRAAFQR